MRLYLIRHGESEANRKGVYAGQTDSPLTDKGIQDAMRAREIISGIPFNRVYSSDIPRAIHTQRIALPEATAIQTKLIREIDVGNLVGRSLKDWASELGEEFLNNVRKSNYSPYGGENAEQLQGRVQEFLKLLENDPCDKVAAFTHAGFVNMVLKTVLGCEYVTGTVVCHNCSVNVFDYNNGRWQLVVWNYTGNI